MIIAIIIWILFAVLTSLITAKRHYKSCMLVYDKVENIIMSCIVGFVYGIFGPVGFVLIGTDIVSDYLIAKN